MPTCVHVYLGATNYWLPLGWVDRHTDEGSGSGEALSLRIHHLRNTGTPQPKLSNFRDQSSETGAFFSTQDRHRNNHLHLADPKRSQCNAIIVRTPELGDVRNPRCATADAALPTAHLAVGVGRCKQEQIVHRRLQAHSLPCFFIRSAWLLSFHAVRGAGPAAGSRA